MLNIKDLGKFIIVSYDIDKTGEIKPDELLSTPFTYFQDVVYIMPTSIEISYSMDKIIQSATIQLPYIEDYTKPDNIFKIVEIWFYDQNENGVCIFRGLVKDISVSKTASSKTVVWYLEDVLSWLEYYTNIYYKERVFLNIKDFLEELIKRIKLFYNLKIGVDYSKLKPLFLEGVPLVSLDKTNALDNIKKFISQTAFKIFYNPRKNVFELNSILYTVVHGGFNIFEIKPNNIISINYKVFSNYYVGVRVNTISVGYSFMKEKMDSYESVIVYDPFLINRTDFKENELECRLLDIWVEPQTSREALINIAKERLLQIMAQQMVEIRLIPTKEVFEMWLGDWVKLDTYYYIHSISYEISPSNISITLNLKKFVTFELGEEIKARWEFWDKSFVDTFWDKESNNFEVFD